VLIELGVVEQRHKAVLEVLAGLFVTEVALRYGVMRQTVHRWLRRYTSGGIGALADPSLRPATCPSPDAGRGRGAHRADEVGAPGLGPRAPPLPGARGSRARAQPLRCLPLPADCISTLVSRC
jgi:hypothetical protein